VPATAHTRVLDTAPSGLLAALPAPTGTLAFVEDGDGLAGWGEYARITTTGADAARTIGEWFAAAIAELDVRDDVGVPGSGPIAFVSLGFDDTDTSVAVIPSVLLGRRDGVPFLTTIGDAPALVDPEPITSPGPVSYSDAGLSATAFAAAVARATTRIRRGEAGKVVLAHGLQAHAARPLDERFLLRRLAAAYPTCVTFAVAGLVGASPELLLRRRGPDVLSRVLAGTAWPETETAGASVEAGLLVSAKDRAEHEFAVRSVAEALEPVVSELTVPPAPRPLTLANLTHMASDVTARLRPSTATALDLVALLHPTAAVGGTPRAVARAMIRELEPAPRGRYAAPVGWIDRAGDGEFAIALRCAEVSGPTARLMAGCGIVADSDPATEVREAQIKMVPIRDALECDEP
jgi:menaquinone-specific isochorismate synthase